MPHLVANTCVRRLTRTIPYAHDCVIILTILTKETRFNASLNISNREHSHYGSNSTQIPLYDFASPNANSSTASMTNTLTFVCYNHIKYQIPQNQLINLQEISKHDSILPYHHEQTRIHKIAIITINKIDHFNKNASFPNNQQNSQTGNNQPPWQSHQEQPCQNN